MKQQSPTQHPAAISAAWHALTIDSAIEQLHSHSAHGLTTKTAHRRQQKFGPNSIREAAQRSAWQILFAQLRDIMLLVLIAAAIITGAIGDLKDTIVILSIVLLNLGISFVQEYRSERAIAALKKMAPTNATVVRDGEIAQIPASALVSGDIVLLEAGNIVPADLRLIETAGLKIDESVLTGEAVTIEKNADVIIDTALPLADRINMAYKGTTATFGRARGLVAATGMHTELGKIAALLETSSEPKTPLQKRLAIFSKRIGIAIFAICVIIFSVGLLRGEDVALMFLTAVSLAVAAIPEALPTVISIALAFGARKMARQHALIRRLAAVETLGSVTYICSDKTGTLTQNKMQVETIVVDGIATSDWHMQAQQPWPNLFTALALSNDAERNRAKKIVGDPTEIALYRAALRANFDKETLQKNAPRILELPFDSQRKCMTTFHADGGGNLIAYTKGAPEAVLPRCINALSAQGSAAIDSGEILAQAERMAAAGLRVLAFAQREWQRAPLQLNSTEVEAELTFIALVGLIDPPRREAAQAVAECKTAGITPVMITGDHPATATAIARQLGIIDGDGTVLSGRELAQLDAAELEKKIASVRVFARVDPAQKIRIVTALQHRGEFVAMTGDGVNDAPALKSADIGVAMGKGGTDVAREASSLVLLDDNFATIVSAVREGRRIYDNIRKFIRYVMTGNAGEIWTIFLAPLLGLPIPLLPIHILWVNLVTDGLPGLALAAEPAELDIMRRPPRPPHQSIFAQGMWQHMIWAGLAIGAVSLFTQAWALHIGSPHWQTMVFTVLTLSQLGHVLAIRSEHLSLFKQGIASNPQLIGALLITLLLQLATIYVPFLNPIFNTAPLTPGELGFCLALSSVVFFCVEIEKWLARRGIIYAPTHNE